MRTSLLIFIPLVLCLAACSHSKPPAPPAIAESRIAALLADRTEDHGILQVERARGGLYLDVFYRQGVDEKKKIRDGAWRIPESEDVGKCISATDPNGLPIPIQPAVIDAGDYVGRFHLTPVSWSYSEVGPCHQSIQTARGLIEIQRYPVRINDIAQVDTVEVHPTFWRQLGLPVPPTTRYRVPGP
mgnify:CR=1 FL=1